MDHWDTRLVKSLCGNRLVAQTELVKNFVELKQCQIYMILLIMNQTCLLYAIQFLNPIHIDILTACKKTASNMIILEDIKLYSWYLLVSRALLYK